MGTIFVLDDALADVHFPGGAPGVTELGCVAADDFFVGAGDAPAAAMDTSFWIVFY